MTTAATTSIATGGLGAGGAARGRLSGGALVWWVVVALVLTGGVGSAGMLVLGGRLGAAGADVWMGFLAASVVATVAAGVGLVPVLVGMRGLGRGGNHNQLLLAWVVGSVLRGGTALLGCFIAAFVFKTHAVTTFLVMVLYYFAVLIAETAVLVSGLRK